MSIFSDILNVIVNIFRSAAEKAWSKLGKDLQGQAITAASLAQAIKTSIGVGYGEFAIKAAGLTGLTVSQVNAAVMSIAKDFGLNEQSADKAYLAIQSLANKVDSDNGWNAIWQNVMKFAATYISSGRLDWITLSLGVAQLAYEKLSKKK